MVPEYNEEFNVKTIKELEDYAKSFGVPIYYNIKRPYIWYLGFHTIRECMRNRYPIIMLGTEEDESVDNPRIISVSTDIYLRTNKKYRRLGI